MSLPHKIVFIESVHEILEQKLTEAGFECIRRFDATREELISEMHEYYGLVIRSRITLDKSFLDSCDNLKFIARSGSGLENIDTDYAKVKGIAIFNSPEGNRDAVGEHAVGMLLMLFNKLNIANGEVRRGEWNREKNRGIELSGKTVGIIGYGVMGSGFAEKLSGFGCRVIAHDKYKRNFGSEKVQEVSVEEIHQESDILSIHLPLTTETHYYVDENFLDRFSKPIFLINTARGKHVKIGALVNSLKSGCVLGACLDVLEYELPSLKGLDVEASLGEYRELLAFPNVVLTPHIAGWTHESYFKLSEVLVHKVLTWYSQNGQ